MQSRFDGFDLPATLGSIPPELCVTALKPDIVILDNHKKNIHLFELTCPGEKYIKTRHIEKSNKYAHFQTTITEYSCNVNCFKVSAKGFLTKRNHTKLNTLQHFMKPEIKQTQFKSNISRPSLSLLHTTSSCAGTNPTSWPPCRLEKVKWIELQLHSGGAVYRQPRTVWWPPIIDEINIAGQRLIWT